MATHIDAIYENFRLSASQNLLDLNTQIVTVGIQTTKLKHSGSSSTWSFRSKNASIPDKGNGT
jgi:hypothetical protein